MAHACQSRLAERSATTGALAHPARSGGRCRGSRYLDLMGELYRSTAASHNDRPVDSRGNSVLTPGQPSARFDTPLVLAKSWSWLDG